MNNETANMLANDNDLIKSDLKTVKTNLTYKNQISIKPDIKEFTITHSPTKDTFFYNSTKRFIDIVMSSIALILLSPVFLIIILIIKYDDFKASGSIKNSALFKHKRWGKNGNPITIHKFRSMVCNAEQLKEQFTPEQKAEFEKNYKLKDDPRVTHLGKFLRKNSIDELPQLFDVLKGEMTIVGPRPIVEKELDKYGMYKDLFLSVKPGITGYWQISGRNDTTYEDRVKMELYYIKNRSLLLDIKIILKTVLVVLTRKGAY